MVFLSELFNKTVAVLLMSISILFTSVSSASGQETEICQCTTKWLYINKHGKFVSAQKKDLSLQEPSQHYEPIEKFFSPYGKVIKSAQKQVVFVPSNIVLNHSRLSHFSEKLAWVEVTTEAGEQRIGYIHKNNKLVLLLDPEVKMAGDFHDGIAPIFLKRHGVNVFGQPTEGQLAFINKKGKVIFTIPNLGWPLDLSAHFYALVPPIQFRFCEGLVIISLKGSSISYIDKKGKAIGSYCAGMNFHHGVAKVDVVVNAKGKILDNTDNSCGYQNQLDYEKALQDLLLSKLANLQSDKSIQFEITADKGDSLYFSLEHSSGDAEFDAKVLTAAKSIVPPKRGLLLSWSSVTWQWLNGNLFPVYSPAHRHPKTHPTLPEGAPIPDAE